jgi:NitT/TauT family transport system substrate-binding protein
VVAVSRVQCSLKANPEAAFSVAEKFFSTAEATMIGDVLRRDLPFYEIPIPGVGVMSMNDFARSMGYLTQDVDYNDVVASNFKHLWTD